MRPIMNGEEVGGGTAMEKQSLADVEFLWNEWEVHAMILSSLFLQVFLFVFAGWRRRSSCCLIPIVLWLAYLLADSVAIFVLGHLAVRASKSGHHLMYFWAPFVLVHLGGQDTITALSKQDNELWMRHLLTLVTQTSMAGYIVAKASWTDGLLKAAMVIMFLSGCFKYVERTICLLFASPDLLKCYSVERLSGFAPRIKKHFGISEEERNIDKMRGTLDTMWKGSPIFWNVYTLYSFKLRIPDLRVCTEILSVDRPVNGTQSLSAENLHDMLNDFLSNGNRHRAYEYVGAWLVHCYRCLYTKFPLRLIVTNACLDFIQNLRNIVTHLPNSACILPWGFLLLLYALFHYVSTPIALVLFWTAEKDQSYTASRADITVSYTLLVGALILDVSSAIQFLVQYLSIMPGKRKLLCHCGDEWCQEILLHQHNMIENRRGSSLRMSRVRFCSKISALCEVGSSIPVPKDGKSPIQEFILDNLLRSGTRKEWNIGSSRGKLAIQKWMDSHQDADSARTTGKALKDSISFDFPISVLIWHIATDMCYYHEVKTSTDHEKSKNHKQISRELSNYIMYLIFKCGVTLTVNFQVVLENTVDEMRRVCKIRGTEDAVRKLFEAMEKKESSLQKQKKDSSVIEIRKVEEPVVNKHEDSAVIEILKFEEPVNEEEQANDNNAAAGSYVQELQQRAQTAHSQILPFAYQVAQELISINDECDRWELIVAVWAEMLYYIAPRCGPSFHYEHLSTGGEFITHVLLLMYFLGPFLPTPGAGVL